MITVFHEIQIWIFLKLTFVCRCCYSPCCVEMTVKPMDGVVHHPTSKALKFTLCITMTMGQLVIRVRLHFFVFKLYVPFLLSDTSGGSPFYRLEWAAHQHFPFWNNQSHNKLITLQRNFVKRKNYCYVLCILFTSLTATKFDVQGADDFKW